MEEWIDISGLDFYEVLVGLVQIVAPLKNREAWVNNVRQLKANLSHVIAHDSAPFVHQHLRICWLPDREEIEVSGYNQRFFSGQKIAQLVVEAQREQKKQLRDKVGFFHSKEKEVKKGKEIDKEDSSHLKT